MATRTVEIAFLGSTKDLEAALARAGIAADAAGGAIGSKFETAGGKVSGIFGKLGNTLSKWGIPFGASIAEVGNKFDEIEGKGKKFGAAMAEVGKVSLAAAAVGIIAIGAESIKSAEKFQSAMSVIQTQAHASAGEVKTMSKAVLGLAGQVATSPETLAAGLYHVESAGYRGATALSLLKTAAEGAKVGHANLEDVTNALDAAIVVGIPGVKNYQQAMGVLNATVGAGDMRMQDLAEAFGGPMLATVKGYGLSIKDVGAALAVFGDSNIRGADAATMLRMATQSLAVPAAAGATELKKLGLTTTSLRDEMENHGLLPTLEMLKTHLDDGGISANQMGGVLTEVFGKKAGGGLNVLMDQLDRLKSKYGDISAGATSFGTDWQTTQQTLSFQTDKLKTTIEALGTSFGEFLIPKLEDAAKAISTTIQWFEEHKTVAEALAISVGTVLVAAIVAYMVQLAVAVGSTIAGFASMVASGASWLIEQTASLGESMALWAMYAAEHAGAAVAFIAENAAMAASATAAFVAENAATLGIGVGIAALIAGVVLLATHWKEVWGVIKSAATDAWHFLDNDVLHPIENAFDGVISWIKGHWETLVEILVAPFAPVLAVVLTFHDQIFGFFERLPGEIGHVFETLGSILEAPFKLAFDGIARLWNDSIGKLSFHVPSWIPGIGGKGFDVPKIPLLATGGIVNQPTLAVVGEAGPEMVIPLSQLGNFDPTSGSGFSPLPQGMTSSSSGAGSTLPPIYITTTHQMTISADMNTPQAQASLKKMLDEHDETLVARIRQVVGNR
jgi:TP901 family phage tail tape measure protein